MWLYVPSALLITPPPSLPGAFAALGGAGLDEPANKFGQAVLDAAGKVVD